MKDNPEYETELNYKTSTNTLQSYLVETVYNIYNTTQFSVFTEPWMIRKVCMQNNSEDQQRWTIVENLSNGDSACRQTKPVSLKWRSATADCKWCTSLK